MNIVTANARGDFTQVAANFNVVDVTRALWSVGLICDKGFDAKFTKHSAKIFDERGVELCHFERRGGLYVTTVQIENPLHADFRRRGQQYAIVVLEFP